MSDTKDHARMIEARDKVEGIRKALERGEGNWMLDGLVASGAITDEEASLLRTPPPPPVVADHVDVITINDSGTVKYVRAEYIPGKGNVGKPTKDGDYLAIMSDEEFRQWVEEYGDVGEVYYRISGLIKLEP
jgi:hypothetical protein